MNNPHLRNPTTPSLRGLSTLTNTYKKENVMLRSLPKKLYIVGLLLTVILLSAFTVLVNPMNSKGLVSYTWTSQIENYILNAKIRPSQSNQLYTHSEALLKAIELPLVEARLAQSNRLYQHSEAMLKMIILPIENARFAQSNRLYQHSEALLKMIFYPKHEVFPTPPH